MEKKDIYDDYFHIEHGKAGKRSDVHLLNPNLISGSVENVSSYLSLVKETIHNFKSDYSSYKKERRKKKEEFLKKNYITMEVK